MKVLDLNISQWQDLVIEAAGVLQSHKTAPLATRCENTVLTTGWHCGGFTMGSHLYTAFAPATSAGTTAMLAVRDDFLRWVTKRLRADEKAAKAAATAAQPTLF